MKRLLVFTGWYPTEEHPLQYPFVAQQVKILQKYLPQLSGETWKIVVWHQTQPGDLPNIILRGKKRTQRNWNDEGIEILRRQGVIISHRIQSNQNILVKRSYRKTYSEIIKKLDGVPDLVLTVTLSSAILWDWISTQLKIDVPFILQEHSNPLSMHLKKSYKIKAAKKMAEYISQTIVVAERQIEEFKELSDQFNCKIIWNSVHESFLNTDFEKKIEPYSILFVGRLSQEKGLRRLFYAIKQVEEEFPKIKLWIVGYGELKSDLLITAEELEIENKVKFLGSAKPPEISEIMESAELFVLPSIYENCPVSLLEAQVKGMPCIVTENNASEKVLLHGNGMAVSDSGDGKQLAEGLKTMLTNMDQYDRKTIRDRAIQEFSPEVFAEKMYLVFKDVLK